MTTCTPLKPFRAWQYRKDSTESVPEWALWSLPMVDGWWVVHSEWHCAVYTPAEFAERFRVTTPTSDTEEIERLRLDVDELRSLLAQWRHNCTGMHGSQSPCGLSADYTAAPLERYRVEEGK
jgi:hypothetical protein